MSESTEAILAALVGGPALLSWGLFSLQKKRLVENTSTSRVRSAAMGLVELSGTSQERTRDQAPVSRVPCCWWRCVVEEKVSAGRRRAWQTIQTLTSPHLFYLEDPTGRVLVDPEGAELQIDEEVFYLRSAEGTAVEAALNSWGIDTANWLGGSKPIRVREQLILPRSPLYVLGELRYYRDQLEDRKQRFAERLRSLKRDPAKMAGVDTNQDGVVDSEEWDAFRMRQEEVFLKEEAAREGKIPASDKRVVRAPVDQPFLLATRSESDLLRSLRLWSVLGVLGGIAIAGLGVWLSVRHGFSSQRTIAFATSGALAGFVVAKFMQKKGGGLWNRS